MPKLIVLALLVFNFSHATSQELDPIIFSSKQDNEASKISSSSYVVEKKEIENKGHLRAVEILKRIPGIEISQTGVIGGESSVFIRGAEGRHTAILIDGVKIYDPTGVSRTFNLTSLNTLDIEKIEVLKGSQSVLYGSDAIGGVINIITKKGEGKNRVKAGFGMTRQASIGHTFDFDSGLLFVNGYYQDSEVASDADDKNIEDVKVNKGLTVTGGFQKGDFDLETVFKYVSDFGEVDSQDLNGDPIDNNDAFARTESIFLNQGVKYNISSEEKVFVDFGYSSFERKNNTGGSGRFEYEGSVFKTEGRYLKNINDGNFVVGLNRSSEVYTDEEISDETLVSYDIFGNRTQDYAGFTLDYGGRLATNENFGSHIVYNLGASKKTSQESIFKASMKTGFKAPSTYQLFGESPFGPVGNDELTPEKSRYVEVGYDYLEKSFSLGTALFKNDIENYIGFGAGGYENEDSLEITGIDSYLKWILGKHNLGFNLGLYSYSLNSDDQDNVARRPTQSFDTFYDIELDDEHSVGASFSYRGERFDYVGGDEKTLGSYHLIDLNYSFTKEDLKFTGIVKNALDTDYELVHGYNTQGRGFQLNLEYIY